MSNQQPFVAILMGSDSDLPTMRITFDTLKQLGIRAEVNVLSAHRTPDQTHAYVKDAESRGCAVFIAAAGLAAHLGGVVASLTVRPVIGVPMDGGPLQGMDALLSTVQMPGGIPVGCVAIGKAGAKNAGYLAAQILGITNSEIAENLRAERIKNANSIVEKNQAIKSEFN